MEVYIKIYIVFLMILVICFISSTFSLIRAKCDAPCGKDFHREHYYPYSGKYCNCVYDKEDCPKNLFKNAKIVEREFNKRTGEWDN